MKRITGWAVLLVLLVAAGVCWALMRDDPLPADGSSAAWGMMLLEKGQGLYVLAVMQGSPADDSGVQPGDYLLAVGEEPLRDLTHLETLLGERQGSVPLLLRRNGQELSILLQTR